MYVSATPVARIAFAAGPHFARPPVHTPHFPLTLRLIPHTHIPQGAQAALKEACLLSLCSRSFSGGRTIVFFRTKQRAHRAKILFGLCGLPPAGVRGGPGKCGTF